MAVLPHKVEIRCLFPGLKAVCCVELPHILLCNHLYGLSHYFFISQLSFFLIFSYPVREYPGIL